MALPETTRTLRAKNMAKATELKGNVLDLMKQTVNHCQSLKETASIAVKILHARLLSDHERQNQQLQLHQTSKIQKTYDKYMQVANSWRCELRDIDTRMLQLQECMEQNVPQLCEVEMASHSTGDSNGRTMMVMKTGPQQRDTLPKGSKLLIKKNRPRQVTGGENSDPTLTSTRETSSARSVKKAHRRPAEVSGQAGSSASEVLPHRTRAVNAWVSSGSKKKKKATGTATTTTPRKQAGRSSGRSARKTRFPKVESGLNTSLVALLGTRNQDGSSSLHNATPHPWPDIFKKTAKDDTDTSAVRRTQQTSPALGAPTGNTDGSSTCVFTALRRSESTTKTPPRKPSTSKLSALRTADRAEDEAAEARVETTLPALSKEKLGDETTA